LAEFGTTARGVVNVDQADPYTQCVTLHAREIGDNAGTGKAGALRRKLMLWESIQEDLVDV
jgi:hypothetical protein